MRVFIYIVLTYFFFFFYIRLLIFVIITEQRVEMKTITGDKTPESRTENVNSGTGELRRTHRNRMVFFFFSYYV